MKLEPVALVAPAREARVPVRWFWSVLATASLAGASFGFATGGERTLSSPANSEVTTVEPAAATADATRSWLDLRAGLEPEDLLPEVDAYLDAVADLGDPAYLPAIERLAYAILEEAPALAGRRAELARAIVSRLPRLPDSAELRRVRPALEALR